MRSAAAWSGAALISDTTVVTAARSLSVSCRAALASALRRAWAATRRMARHFSCRGPVKGSCPSVYTSRTATTRPSSTIGTKLPWRAPGADPAPRWCVHDHDLPVAQRPSAVAGLFGQDVMSGPGRGHGRDERPDLRPQREPAGAGRHPDPAVGHPGGRYQGLDHGSVRVELGVDARLQRLDHPLEGLDVTRHLRGCGRVL